MTLHVSTRGCGCKAVRWGVAQILGMAGEEGRLPVLKLHPTDVYVCSPERARKDAHSSPGRNGCKPETTQVSVNGRTGRHAGVWFHAREKNVGPQRNVDPSRTRGTKPKQPCSRLSVQEA